jgi:hypothetical protein
VHNIKDKNDSPKGDEKDQDFQGETGGAAFKTRTREMDDDQEERDVLLSEGLFELHRKRKVN